ncbi:MAG: Tex family protein [Planctomycetaceae bacterium]
MKDDLFLMDRFLQDTAGRLQVRPEQVEGAVRLLEDGNTIPFIARYRREATRGLDERQLRQIEDLLGKSRDLAARKSTILSTIAEQGKLTPQLQQEITSCSDPARLEDLYLPYRPRRRTRAAAARERGLQPLADILLSNAPFPEPRTQLLRRFLSADKGVPDEAAALQGACDIAAELWADDPENRRRAAARIRQGELRSDVKPGKSEEGTRFRDYFDCRQRVAGLPGHRFLALQRGETEGVLRLRFETDDEAATRELSHHVLRNTNPAFAAELQAAAEDCYSRLLRPSAENAVLGELREKADLEAVEVFAKNLHDLLMAAPAGPRTTIGVDPGFRTGCKLAVVDGTGKFLAAETIYPTPPRNDLEQSERVLLRLIREQHVELIAIGNGTASREADKFVADVLRKHSIEVTRVMVSEAGASVYSASESAIEEYPELDVTIRGAISIAHRLQDPLAELVKIDPKSIGVGQYQHDVDQPLLQKALEREVESCVNAVGVDLNTASAALLSRVAGIGSVLAKRIVGWRDEHGRFMTRRELLKVPRLGQKAFQQAAGFLRIRGGQEPLDASAVHPEQYPLVQQISVTLHVPVTELVGNERLVSGLKAEQFVSSEFGGFTVRDVLAELARPGRDPRREFRTARFTESVSELEQLQPGMVLEGVVTNVTKFGAFVDIGVHQDGLVHISQLADRFIRDPAEVVSAGDIIRVTVLEVDTNRRRIALTCRAQSGQQK